MINIKTAVCT